MLNRPRTGRESNERWRRVRRGLNVSLFSHLSLRPRSLFLAGWHWCSVIFSGCKSVVAGILFVSMPKYKGQNRSSNEIRITGYARLLLYKKSIRDSGESAPTYFGPPVTKKLAEMRSRRAAYGFESKQAKRTKRNLSWGKRTIPISKAEVEASVCRNSTLEYYYRKHGIIGDNTSGHGATVSMPSLVRRRGK